MKVFDIHAPNGQLLAFEVKNLFLPRRLVCRVVKNIPGARLVRTPRIFSWFREASFCEFEVDGEIFEAEELFGDNDRYWIGPVAVIPVAQIAKVKKAFAAW